MGERHTIQKTRFIMDVYPLNIVVRDNEGGSGSFIRYGQVEYFPMVGSLPIYLLDAKDLRKIGCGRRSFTSVNSETEARRISFGRYQIRRKDNPGETITIPRRESLLIRAHLN